MDPEHEPDAGTMDEPVWRIASRSRCYAYIVPCRDEDILKIGFSRDPLTRFHTLHARYFEFFDLERGALIEMDYVRDARRVETMFKERFAEFRAPAPLVVPESAAGHTEWYRGIYDDAIANAEAIGVEYGFRLHTPLRAWLRAELERNDALYDWSSKAYEIIEYEHFNAIEPSSGYARALRDALDAFEAVGLSLDDRVPEKVLAWRRFGFAA